MNYLILPSHRIGGSEIRLVNNWIYTRQWADADEIKLVISPELISALSERTEIARGFEQYRDALVITSFPADFQGIQQKLKHLVDGGLPDLSGALILLHMPFNKLQRKKSRLVYIHPGTSFAYNSNLKGVVGQVLSILHADHIDVLDPHLFRLFRRLFFFKRSKFHLTRFGVSQDSFDLLDQVNYEQKKNQIAFVGRFVALKQAVELLECLEYAAARITEAGVKDASFVLIGHGPQEQAVARLVKALQEKGVHVTLLSSGEPFPTLRASKGYFSLQRYNNYPSQGLVESILCGCLPVITDCGTTREMVTPDFGYFVPEIFSKEDIAGACVRLLTAPDFKEKSAKAIAHLQRSFSTERMARYYNSLLK